MKWKSGKDDNSYDNLVDMNQKFDTTLIPYTYNQKLLKIVHYNQRLFYGSELNGG